MLRTSLLNVACADPLGIGAPILTGHSGSATWFHQTGDGSLSRTILYMRTRKAFLGSRRLIS
jgi:hypothetical protein